MNTILNYEQRKHDLRIIVGLKLFTDHRAKSIQLKSIPTKKATDEKLFEMQ